MMDDLPHPAADNEFAWLVPAIFLIFAAAGYGLVMLSDFNAMLKSLKSVAVVQRFVGGVFIVVGLALTLAFSWIIFVD